DGGRQPLTVEWLDDAASGLQPLDAPGSPTLDPARAAAVLVPAAAEDPGSARPYKPRLLLPLLHGAQHGGAPSGRRLRLPATGRVAARPLRRACRAPWHREAPGSPCSSPSSCSSRWAPWARGCFSSARRRRASRARSSTPSAHAPLPSLPPAPPWL